MKTLLQKVSSDISDFLKSGHAEVFFNERDLQVRMASYLLRTGRYDDVDLEYYVPHDELDGYVWNSEIRLDIVVRSGQEFLPVELKFKTRTLKKSLSRFGENLDDVVVLKNQGAQDLGMYDFWKDVRRVEMVRNRFGNVRNGICVFVTNDDSYTRMGKNPEVNNAAFSMKEGTHPCGHYWKRETSITKTRPGFCLDTDYSIHWENMEMAGLPFLFCLLTI